MSNITTINVLSVNAREIEEGQLVGHAAAARMLVARTGVSVELAYAAIASAFEAQKLQFASAN